MCRLFALRASHVIDAATELVTAQHSLCQQARCDRTDRDHSDGWGLASYRGTALHYERHPVPAYDDDRYAKAIDECRGKTIVAHVRRATRGVRKVDNCHPFVLGRWVFVHNGTLTAVDSLRKSMMQEISRRWHDKIHGETDSELIFYWTLQRLVDDKAITGNHCRSLAKMRLTIAGSLVELDRRNMAAEAAMGLERSAKLNLVLTNGSVMVGTRLRNSMYYHVATRANQNGHPYRTVRIASEPPDARRWKEIPDASVFSISSRVTWHVTPLVFDRRS